MDGVEDDKSKDRWPGINPGQLFLTRARKVSLQAVTWSWITD